MKFTVQYVLLRGDMLGAEWVFAEATGFAGSGNVGQSELASRFPEMKAAARAPVPAQDGGDVQARDHDVV
jgi:hypothetical protein